MPSVTVRDVGQPDHDKLKLCQGCRNDFYNHPNEQGIKRCWFLARAKVVTRYKLGWWTTPSPTAYTEVKTLSCHEAPGQYALYESIPGRRP